MTKSKLNQILVETVAEIQQQQIDKFLEEFKDFDLKSQKKDLELMHRRFQELKKYANQEMYEESSLYTRSFYKVAEDIKQLNDKIKRYQENKDLIDTFARTHKQYVLKKHGKIV